eukprot:g1277.t1
MEGHLEKQSAHLKKWNKRYCRLIPASKVLLYYQNPSDIELNITKGSISLENSRVLKDLPGLCFDLITSSGVAIHWRAESEDVKRKWVEWMQKAGAGDVPDQHKSITFKKDDRDAHSTYIAPSKIKQELRKIVSADAEMTFRGVRRTLEENLGLDEGELYSVRDELNALLNEVITEKAHIGLQITSPSQHVHAGRKEAAWSAGDEPALDLGCKLSVLSPTGVWRSCTIVEIDSKDKRRVKVHYDEFNAKHDEWIEPGSERIRSPDNPVTPRGAKRGDSSDSAAGDATLRSSGKDGGDPQWLFTGQWVADEKRCNTTLEPMMEALGVPWAARKFVNRVVRVQDIEHSALRLTVTDRSEMGVKTSSFTLDGQERQVPIGAAATAKQEGEGGEEGAGGSAPKAQMSMVTAYENRARNSFTVETIRPDGKYMTETRTLNRAASEIRQVIEITSQKPKADSGAQSKAAKGQLALVDRILVRTRDSCPPKPRAGFEALAATVLAEEEARRAKKKKKSKKKKKDDGAGAGTASDSSNHSTHSSDWSGGGAGYSATSTTSSSSSAEDAGGSRATSPAARATSPAAVSDETSPTASQVQAIGGQSQLPTETKIL